MPVACLRCGHTEGVPAPDPACDAPPPPPEICDKCLAAYDPILRELAGEGMSRADRCQAILRLDEHAAAHYVCQRLGGKHLLRDIAKRGLRRPAPGSPPPQPGRNV